MPESLLTKAISAATTNFKTAKGHVSTNALNIVSTRSSAWQSSRENTNMRQREPSLLHTAQSTPVTVANTVPQSATSLSQMRIVSGEPKKPQTPGNMLAQKHTFDNLR